MRQMVKKEETCKYTQVDGVDVITSERPPSGAPSANGAPIRTVWRLLLANETEVFGCDHPGDPNCMTSFPSAQSVLAHQRTHSHRSIRKEADVLKDKLAEVEAERKASFERRSNGIKLGKQRAREREANGDGPTDAIAKLARAVIMTHNAMHDAIDEHQKAFLAYMKAVADHKPEPQVDPELATKAARYDILTNALKEIK